MSDREMLELAAKAAGIELAHWNDGNEPYSSGNGFILSSAKLWNSLTDDGDALRLAVKLKLHIGMESRTVSAWQKDRFGSFQTEPLGDDENAATRRAITRAAAELGKQLVLIK